MNQSTVLLQGLILLLTASRSPTAASTSQALPNILFILADDLGYGDATTFLAVD